MANWEKLNTKFDTVLNNMTDREWDLWYKNIETKKSIRKEKLLMESIMHGMRLNLNRLHGNTIIQESFVNVNIFESAAGSPVQVKCTSNNEDCTHDNNNSHALAA